jgi:hypothetical protein
MGLSENSFNRVKSLLGKLERSIDEARARRLGDDGAPEPARPALATSPAPLAAALGPDTLIGGGATLPNTRTSVVATPAPTPALHNSVGATQAAPAGPARPASIYGRAQPLPRGN